jgi:hypothetical protein
MRVLALVPDAFGGHGGITGRRYLDMEELREHRLSEERQKNGMMLMER